MKLTTSVALQILDTAKTDPGFNVENILFWDAEDGLYKSLQAGCPCFFIAVDLCHPCAYQLVDQLLLLLQILARNTGNCIDLCHETIHEIFHKLKHKKPPVKVKVKNIQILFYHSERDPEFSFALQSHDEHHRHHEHRLEKKDYDWPGLAHKDWEFGDGFFHHDKKKDDHHDDDCGCEDEHDHEEDHWEEHHHYHHEEDESSLLKILLGSGIVFFLVRRALGNIKL